MCFVHDFNNVLIMIFTVYFSKYGMYESVTSIFPQHNEQFPKKDVLYFEPNNELPTSVIVTSDFTL